MKEKLKSFFPNLVYGMKITYTASPLFFILKGVFTLIQSALPFINIFIWRNVINFLANPEGFDGINVLIINVSAYMMVYLATEFLKRVEQYISYKYNDKCTLFIESIMIEKFAEVDLAFYDSSKLQDKLRQSWQIKNSTTEIGISIFWLLRNIITFTVALVLLAQLSVLYVLVILILLLPVFFIKNNVNTRNYLFYEDNSNTSGRMWYFKSVFSNINSSFDIRLFNLKDFFLKKYIDTWREEYQRRKDLSTKTTVFTLASVIISSFTNQILLYLILIYRLASRAIQIGDAVYYTAIFSHFHHSTNSLIDQFSHMTNYILKQIATVKEFIELKPVVQKSGTLEPKAFKEITFSHVDFKYPGKDVYILQDCTFTIKRGQTIGLVGENGSGKSTIVKLLLRLYDIDGGEILLDGVDIKEFDIVKYRSMFGVLFQDFVKYSFTLRENVSLSDHECVNDDERINDAINKSELIEIVRDWEKKLESPLTRQFEEDGKELSGGQWQRVALARVFFSNRDFIVLDEPSASLDVFAEEKIFRWFEKLSDNRSSLIISHRLSSIVNADVIVVLKDGKIVEKGSHRDLLDSDGYYAELFNLQAGRYVSS